MGFFPGGGETLEVFGGVDSLGDQVVVQFDLVAGTASAGAASATIGSVFGFYLDSAVPGVGRVYSDELLNSGNTELGLIYDTYGETLVVGGNNKVANVVCV